MAAIHIYSKPYNKLLPLSNQKFSICQTTNFFFEINTITKLHNFEMPTCYKLDICQRLSKKREKTLP